MSCGDRNMVARRDAVAVAFGLLPGALVGRGQASHVLTARMAAYWVLRATFPLASLQMLSKVMGGRDHSTFINGLASAERRRGSDPAFREATDALAALHLPGVVPRSIAECFRAEAEMARVLARRVTPRVERRRFNAEYMAYPEPKPHLLAIQLKGGPGCPKLSGEEIARRREGVAAARRAREIALLEIEAAKYGLRRRGRALSEMPA